jgi:predicted HicB family RNase H-like nuclease
MMQWLEAALLAEHEAPRKVLPLRRRRTSSYQLLLKVKPEVAARFAALADAEGVCFGEFLEKALDAYEREAGQAKER